MSDFYSRLSYSIGNEDWKTEQEALALQPHHRVLCVTGSGDRPLNLLTSGCQEVVAIDVNKIQNNLLALKAKALEELSFEEYLAFLGASTSTNRMQVLDNLGLKDEVKTFWQQHKKMIAKGVLYQGALERVLKKSSFLISLLRREKVEKLFSFETIEEQRAYVTRHWNKPYFRKILAIFLRPSITKMVLNDPGLVANLMPSLNIGTYLYDRIQAYLNRYPAKESLLLNLILNRKLAKEAMPPYLQKEGVSYLKKRIHSLSWVTSNLISYLEKAPDNSFDGFSIADVASYLSEDDYHRLLYAMKRVAKPGARFCMRQFLSAHHIPEPLQRHFSREPHLEERLEKDDRCMVYRFMVGTVTK